MYYFRSFSWVPFVNGTKKKWNYQQTAFISMLHTTLFWRYTIAHDQIKNNATELMDLQRNTVQFSPPLYIDTYIHYIHTYIQNITSSRGGQCFAGRSRLFVSSKLLLFLRIMSFHMQWHWLDFLQQDFFKALISHWFAFNVWCKKS